MQEMENYVILTSKEMENELLENMLNSKPTSFLLGRDFRAYKE